MVPVIETVRASGRTYPVHIGPGAFSAAVEAAETVRRAGGVVVTLTCPGVRRALPREVEQLAALGPVHVTTADGETAKSPIELMAAWESLAKARVGRDGAIIALGGGVVGDLAGFVAASWLRGVPVLQIPTTLLAMVDSSVGGKTGINLPAGKNLVGAFHAPVLVAADTDLLASLPAREMAAGMAEVLKYGLLGEAALLAEVEAAGQIGNGHPALPGIIRRCVRRKADIVEGDERETAVEGGRALLNLGHTFGHAIEAVAGYGDYLHGEAVGVGLAMAASLSCDLGLLSSADAARVASAVRSQGLADRLRTPLSADALLAAMRQDKKNRGGRIRFVVLEALGRAVTREGVEETTARRVLLAHGAV